MTSLCLSIINYTLAIINVKFYLLHSMLCIYYAPLLQLCVSAAKRVFNPELVEVESRGFVEGDVPSVLSLSKDMASVVNSVSYVFLF